MILAHVMTLLQSKIFTRPFFMYPQCSEGHNSQRDRWVCYVDFISMNCRVSVVLGVPSNRARCAAALLLGCWELGLRSLCEIASPYRDHLCARGQGVSFYIHGISFVWLVFLFCLLMRPFPLILATGDLSLI